MTKRPHSDDIVATRPSNKIGKLKPNRVTRAKPNVRRQRLTRNLRTYDDQRIGRYRALVKSVAHPKNLRRGNQVFSAIRLISAENLDQIDGLHTFKSLPMLSH